MRNSILIKLQFNLVNISIRYLFIRAGTLKLNQIFSRSEGPALQFEQLCSCRHQQQTNLSDEEQYFSKFENQRKFQILSLYVIYPALNIQNLADQCCWLRPTLFLKLCKAAQLLHSDLNDCADLFKGDIFISSRVISLFVQE